METAAIQSVEKKITMVALANVQPSNYNPRKNFDETSLAELSESICRQGVLQPIGVRPMGDGRFEIVFGERRYRASLMVGLEEIPAVVMDISDEMAEEMAITENLQRKDVTPIEEATAYQKLMDSGRYDVQSLSVQFGKGEDYIRTRLKFVSLIPEIAQLLEQDEITISVASEICRYGEDIQREVYDKHLKEDVQYNSWRGMKAADVARSIERQYTTDLERYAFDKTLCLSCPHNTNNMILFGGGGCGHCANRACLAETNVAFLTEKAVHLMNERPDVPLCRESLNSNGAAVERLVAMGYEVESINYYARAYPVQPEVPRKEDYDTAEAYEQAQGEYEQDLNKYMEECEKVRTRSEAGEIVFYYRIGSHDVEYCYVPKVVCTTNAERQAQTLSPVEKLEKQDRRNKEIAREKTIEDTKKQILEVDMSESKFGQDEEKMVYFFLLAYLRKEHFGLVGIGEKEPYSHLTDEEKMNIVANLTGKQKALIRRDFLIANFKDASGGNATASLLLDFAQKHMPDLLADIKNGHEEVYEKRHQRIEEKKAALLAQEQESVEAEQPGEQQPGVGEHTGKQLQEEIAA